MPPRSVALTIPCVTVWPTPKGLPIASTRSPTRTFWLSASGTVGRWWASILTTAMSLLASSPITLALNDAPVRQSHLDLRWSVYKVAVGQDVAVLSHNHPGPKPALQPGGENLLGAVSLKGVSPGRILYTACQVSKVVGSQGRDNSHHGGCNLVDCRREAFECPIDTLRWNFIN